MSGQKAGEHVRNLPNVYMVERTRNARDKKMIKMVKETKFIRNQIEAK